MTWLSRLEGFRRRDRKGARAIRCLIFGHEQVTRRTTCGERDIPKWLSKDPSQGFCIGALSYTTCAGGDGDTVYDAEHVHRFSRPLLTGPKSEEGMQG